MRQIRLLPFLVLAVSSLLLLKSVNLIFNGKYTITGSIVAEAQQKQSFADEAVNGKNEPEPVAGETEGADGEDGATDDDKGDASEEDVADAGDAEDAGEEGNESESDAAENGEASEDENADGVDLADADDKGEDDDKQPFISRSERILLQRLSERRKQIETREKELVMRESLMKAAEKRIEDRINELKALEGQIDVSLKSKKEKDKEHYSGLVKMYETMKPKDAARIFNTLDMNVLIGVSRNMKPNKLAEVMAKMSSEAAQRLTIQLARLSKGEQVPQSAESDQESDLSNLPKIGS